jgi:hypothetical protein
VYTNLFVIYKTVHENIVCGVRVDKILKLVENMYLLCKKIYKPSVVLHTQCVTVPFIASHCLRCVAQDIK